MRFNKFFMTLATAALLLASSCSTFPTEQTDQAINEVLEEFKAVGASVAVVKDGQIVYNKSFGYKDWENKIPLANDDHNPQNEKVRLKITKRCVLGQKKIRSFWGSDFLISIVENYISK